MSPVLLTSLCRDQLVLALRLFQSQSFLMFPRERRHEGRARAYLALIGRQAGAPAPYVLQGHQVTRFLEFARKLHVFFKRVAKLMVATDLFEQANEVHALSDEMRLLWLVMAAEGCLPTTTRAS